MRDGKGTDVMEGQGTMGGKDKEQRSGGSRSNAWEERTRNIWMYGKELEKEGTRNNVREGR